MVIVCANNMGDIFRRNAFNLGLQVVQCPRRSPTRKDGDELRVRPRLAPADATRRRARPTRRSPLTPRRTRSAARAGSSRSGGASSATSARTARRSCGPIAATARALTTTEQILWAHRVDKDAVVQPGATLRVYADLLPASDGTAPFAIHTFNQITGGDAILPRQRRSRNDHFVFTGKRRRRPADRRSAARSRAHAAAWRSRTTPRPGDGIFHFYFPEQGLVYPGQFIPGADSHSRAYGAYGAIGIGVGSTTLGFGWSTGYVYTTVPRGAPRRRSAARCSRGCPARTSCSKLLRALGREAVAGDVGRVRRRRRRSLPIAYRNTIANMMAEAESCNGIFAPGRACTYAWYRAKGMTDLLLPGDRAGRERRLRARRGARTSPVSSR